MCLLVLLVVVAMWGLFVLLLMAVFGLTAEQALIIAAIIMAGVLIIECFNH